MNIPVTFVFPPAQEVTVRKATPSQESARQLPPMWYINDGRTSDPCGTRNKLRTRSKLRRAVLHMEVI
ncbi:MAG TPA: hypothetical protein VG347_24305 [Verrucomicrobiae bacterium]|nr:hypothetical protein [Verrucomicrobiae bacterium]